MKIVVAFLLLLLASVLPSQAWLRHGGGSASGSAYTAPCSLSGITCAYAFSVDHQMVAGATASFQLTNLTNSATQDVGFLSNGQVNMTTVRTYCLAHADCQFGKVYNQANPGTCDLHQYPTAPGSAPLLHAWAPHGGLPVYLTGYKGTGGNEIFEVLSSDHSVCTAALGNAAKTMLTETNNLLWSTQAGQAGWFPDEMTPLTPHGYLFAWTNWNPSGGGLNCTVSPFLCYLIDIGDYTSPIPGTSGLSGFPTLATQSDIISTVAYDGGSPGNFTANLNGTAYGSVASPYSPLGTEGTITWTEGAFDYTSPGTYTGPAAIFGQLFFASALDAAHQAALVSHEQAFYAGISAGYHGPNDLFLNSGVNIEQVLYMQAGWGLRQLDAGYLGPLVNVCQGTTATCEDIGSTASGGLDVTTANSFCGPSNCTVQIIYGQGINWTEYISNTHYQATQDLVASSGATRPTLVFSCIGSLPCLQGNGSQFLCGSSFNSTSPTIGNGNAYTLAVVAKRTSGTSQALAFGGPGGNTSNLIGFGAANTAEVQTNGGGGANTTTAAAADNAWHSLIMTFGATTNTQALYVDNGTPGTTSVSSSAFYGTGACLFEASGGGAALTGQVEEAMIFAGSGAQSYSFAPSGQVAALNANQHSFWGF